MMGNFWKKNVASGPSFLLLETPLPYHVSNFLLGSVVVDIRNPTHEYRPKSPNNIDFDKYSLEIEDSTVSSLLAANKGHNLEAKLGDILNISSAGKEKKEEFFEGSTIRTRTLRQHRDIKEFLLGSEHRQDILQLLRDNNGRGYLVVGIRSAVGGRRAQKEDHSRDNRIAIQIPVDKIAAAAGSPLLPRSSDAAIVVQSDASNQRETKTNMEGEQIFAVQYRTIQLRKQSRQLKIEVEFGLIKRGKKGDGMFSNDGDRKLVFEDSDEESSEEEMTEEYEHDTTGETSTSCRGLEEDLRALGSKEEILLLF